MPETKAWYKNPMKYALNRLVLIGSVLLLSAACTQPAVKQQPPERVIDSSEVSEDRARLAGEWEYEDGAVVMLRLDERGNGSYAWKEGRFQTMALNGLTWDGMWFQLENDREGGFTVQLSPDFSEGEGRWWYTRIGQDHSPSQKGGTFHLTKRPGSSDQSRIPPP
ncbi:MAG TPA: hypothetical protein VJ746_13890 [Nitrospira sp.]|nr:hypothetical protein [Nitrospira sp.]